MKKIILILITFSTISSCQNTVSQNENYRKTIKNIIYSIRDNDVEKLYNIFPNGKDINEFSTYQTQNIQAGFAKKLGSFLDNRSNFINELKRDFRKGDTEWKKIEPYFVMSEMKYNAGRIPMREWLVILKSNNEFYSWKLLSVHITKDNDEITYFIPGGNDIDPFGLEDLDSKVESIEDFFNDIVEQSKTNDDAIILKYY